MQLNIEPLYCYFQFKFFILLTLKKNNHLFLLIWLIYYDIHHNELSRTPKIILYLFTIRFMPHHKRDCYLHISHARVSLPPMGLKHIFFDKHSWAESTDIFQEGTFKRNKVDSELQIFGIPPT